MITFGEDSLNEGIRIDRIPESGGDASRKENFFADEPTREQLIATGELDPEDDLEERILEEGALGEGALGEARSPSVSMEEEDKILDGQAEEKEQTRPVSKVLVTKADSDLSIRKQVEQGFMGGATKEELIDAGFNKNTVRTVESELRNKMPNKPKGRAVQTTARGMPVFAKGAPPETIIDSIEVPNVTDGGAYPFEQGIKFGMSLVTIGIRMAQELSGIGIMQAKPLLDMAKSMREGEAIAAKNAAGEAAAEAAGMVQESMMPILSNLQKTSGNNQGGGDPIKQMMVKTMEPIIQRLMGSVIGNLPASKTDPQITSGEPDTSRRDSTIEGWGRRSE